MDSTNSLSVIEKDSDYEIVTTHCQICNIEGNVGCIETSPIYLHEITLIPEEIRKQNNIPENYSHHFFGGFGSVIFDLCLVLFTREQAKKLPRYICDNCLSQLLAEETYLIALYERLVATEEGFNFIFARVRHCDGCGRVFQKENKFCLGNEIFEIDKATIENRREYKIPIGYNKYIDSFGYHGHLFGNHDRVIFLFKQHELDGENKFICESCFRQRYKGKEIPYLDYDDRFQIHWLRII